MSVETVKVLALVVLLVSIGAALKLTFFASRPSPLARLLICAWPLSALAGTALPLVLLRFQPGVSLEGLLHVLIEVLGSAVGATALGLVGAIVTPALRDFGAGVGILGTALMALDQGNASLDAFGGAGKAAVGMAAIVGGSFAVLAMMRTRAKAEPAPLAHRAPATVPETPQTPQAHVDPPQPDGVRPAWMLRQAPLFQTEPLRRDAAPDPQARPEISSRLGDLSRRLGELSVIHAPALLTHALFAAAGAVVMAAIVILAGGMAGEKLAWSILQAPGHWLGTPMKIGAVGGAAVSLLLQRRGR